MATASKGNVLNVQQLEGYLVKKHSEANKSRFSFKSESSRWFKVREVVGLEETEWTLAYYESHRAKEAKGFIYLRDVTSIRAADDLSITIKSPARAMTVVAQLQTEHEFWLEGLVHLCSRAEVSCGDNVNLQYKYRARKDEDCKSERVFPGSDAKGDSTIPSSGESERNAPAIVAHAPGANYNIEDADVAPSKTEREDHRLTGYRSGASSSTAARMHGHIRKDAKGGEVEEDGEEDDGNSQNDNDVKGGETERTTPALGDMEDLDTTVVKSSSSGAGAGTGIAAKKSKMLQPPPHKEPVVHAGAREEAEKAKKVRKVCDEADSSAHQKTNTIDDLLSAAPRGRGGSKATYDSDDDKDSGGVDLEKEKRYYADSKAEISTAAALLYEPDEKSEADTRPRSNSLLKQHLMERAGTASSGGYSVQPRPPIQSPPAYAQQVTGVVREPRSDNTAHDWDDGMSYPTTPLKDTDQTRKAEKDKHMKQAAAKAAASSSDKPQSKEEAAAVAAKLGLGTGVRADENWLDDDFDS